MTDMAMSEEDRRELVRLTRALAEAEDRVERAREERNRFMNYLFNTHRADATELAEVAMLRRQNVYLIVDGPRLAEWREGRRRKRREVQR